MLYTSYCLIWFCFLSLYDCMMMHSHISFPSFALLPNRLCTSSRKWTLMETDRYQRLKFWKIKKHSWTVKWQTMADTCMRHTMNYNYMSMFIVEFFSFLVSMKMYRVYFQSYTLTLSGERWSFPSVVEFTLVNGWHIGSRKSHLAAHSLCCTSHIM